MERIGFRLFLEPGCMMHQEFFTNEKGEGIVRWSRQSNEYDEPPKLETETVHQPGCWFAVDIPYDTYSCARDGESIVGIDHDATAKSSAL